MVTPVASASPAARPEGTLAAGAIAVPEAKAVFEEDVVLNPKSSARGFWVRGAAVALMAIHMTITPPANVNNFLITRMICDKY